MQIVNCNSSAQVFAIIKNVEKFIEGTGDIDILECSKGQTIQYRRSKGYYVQQSKRIFNDVAISYYTFYDIAIYMLYSYLFKDKVLLWDIKLDNVSKCVKTFTLSQLKEDKDIIRRINEEIKFKDILDYFEIKEDGYNIIFSLTKKSLISPYFYINYCKNILTNRKEDVILNDELRRFERISLKINNILKIKTNSIGGR
jgi:hypothetical protein